MPSIGQQDKANITKAKRAIGKKISELKNGTKKAKLEGVFPSNVVGEGGVEQNQLLEATKQIIAQCYVHLQNHVIAVQQELETSARANVIEPQERMRLEQLSDSLQKYRQIIQELEIFGTSLNEINFPQFEELKMRLQFYLDMTRKDDLRNLSQKFLPSSHSPAPAPTPPHNPTHNPPPYNSSPFSPSTSLKPTSYSSDNTPTITNTTSSNESNGNNVSALSTPGASSTKDNQTVSVFLQKQKAFQLGMLESSMQNFPREADLIETFSNFSTETVRFTPLEPSLPLDSPPYYPKHLPPSLNNPSLFHNLDTDTLFYIFYYQQNSNQQLFAARELRRKNWYYHTQYLTWFQPFPPSSPFDKSAPFNKGTFVFFDYENGWCQRKKEDFTFETSYLEDTPI